MSFHWQINVCVKIEEYAFPHSHPRKQKTQAFRSYCVQRIQKYHFRLELDREYYF